MRIWRLGESINPEPSVGSTAYLIKLSCVVTTQGERNHTGGAHVKSLKIYCVKHHRKSLRIFVPGALCIVIWTEYYYMFILIMCNTNWSHWSIITSYWEFLFWSTLYELNTSYLGHFWSCAILSESCMHYDLCTCTLWIWDRLRITILHTNYLSVAQFLSDSIHHVWVFALY